MTAATAPASSSSNVAPAHSPAFRKRRFLNWFPLGLSYALLYMGRYNLTVAKNELGDLMTKEDFGVIFAAGTTVYALSFLFNGPLVDRIGGRKGMLTALIGSATMNLIMGAFMMNVLAQDDAQQMSLRLPLSVLYAVNMYFQSFAAVSIVKVNAHWFHVKERGGFSGIFGTMISSGIFFAFTGNGLMLDVAGVFYPDTKATWLVFLGPGVLLAAMVAVEFMLLRNSPADAGFDDFDTQDASSGEDDVPIPTKEVLRRVLTNPIILTVAGVEFCTGVLRNGIMHWFPIYAKEVWALPGDHSLVYGPLKDMLLAPLNKLLCTLPGVGPYGDTLCRSAPSESAWASLFTMILCAVLAAGIAIWAARSRGTRRGLLAAGAGLLFLAPFFPLGWGGLLFVAGVMGGNIAGWVSDLFFQSRRGPAAGGLYAILAVCCVLMFITLAPPGTQVLEAPGVEGLEAGDKIISIDGRATERWADVASAVKCHVPVCAQAQWNAKTCVCTTQMAPTSTSAPATATGATPIAFVVERDGVKTDVSVQDPKPTQRAGDKRKLRARPVLPMSPWWLGIVIFLMSLCVIGTHGLLSGTATMDFGGRKAAATAVGIIDGFVYLGTAVQSVALGWLTSEDWSYWPWFLLPFSIVGFLLLLRIWGAKAGRSTSERS